LEYKQKQLYLLAKNLIVPSLQGNVKTIMDVVPAKSLPSSKGRNAYGNSYYYDPSTLTLYLRAERMENPGEMQMILAHAHAHIRCNNDDDQSPDFQREFYTALANVMSLGISSGSVMITQTGSSSGVTGSSGAASASALTLDLSGEAQVEALIKAAKQSEEVKERQEAKEREDNKRGVLARKETSLQNKKAKEVKSQLISRLAGQNVITSETKLGPNGKNALHKLFFSYDKDGDGCVNQDEFNLMLVKLFQDAPRSSVQIEEQFKSMDRNGDGKIQFEEFFLWFCGEEQNPV